MRNWERPMVTVDTFAANEFVSSCGENHKVYNFECNAGEKNKHYDVFTADGHNLTRDHGFFLFKTRGYYYPCKKTHEAAEDSGFIKGYIVDNHGNDRLKYIDLGGTHEYSKTDVIIWTNNNTDVHCTTNLKMNEWTTAKS